jgi:DNA repair exonuclease SbcCD nuclease subunit
MKIACITDTHISFKKTNVNFHNYFESFYENIFFPELKERGITTVIHLGDAFDNRKGIDYLGLEWAQRVVYDPLKELNIQVYQICGNHDAAMRSTNKYNAISTLLREYENVIPIIDPVEHKIGNTDIFFVPWICKDNEKDTFDLIGKTNAKLLFGHLELSGFSMFPGNLSTHGLSPEKFQKFDRVFSGHFHTRSNDGRVFYLGNPYQMFWSDVDDERGFHIFDTDTYELEFIKNPYKIYKKIYYDEDNFTSIDENSVKGKYIKVVVNNKTEETQYNKFISELSEYDIIDLKIIENIKFDDSMFVIDNLETEDTLSSLNKYIDNSDFSLDKSIVKTILQKIYQEALELEV